MIRLFDNIPDFSREALLAVLSLSLCLLYLSIKIIGRLLFSPLRHVPGPSATKLTGATVWLSTIQGRRAYKLEELHKKYGPVVRTGPNEVSISDWRHLRTIYLNTKGMIKNPDFYKAATFVCKDNIFQMIFNIGIKLPGAIGDSYLKREYWREKSYEMVDHFLEKSADDEKYLLTPLATGVEGYLGRKLTHEELVEEAMGYMFAGSGTTSSTLAYLLYELSKPENAPIQERLRTEVLAIPHDDIVTIRNNTYINAVIKETLRAHPTIISTIPRLLTEPLTLGQYTLPSGTVIGMQNWLHHHDASVFPDPKKFVPERWLNETPEMKSALTPFSLGKRNCIGQNLAWQELYWAVSEVMRSGLRFRVAEEMKHWEMEMEDRFNIAPRGRRLMLTASLVD
ncbi:cytochrome P450 monooxygenase [Fusarium napiforme]|uniref:Cytochrome P450 monooxygenase n=1 Tax=Fusarium napiforme TaxID=42672 RepID=A0A8H5K8B4_9HYPO|nr:cytochrome P450 monooxygenase [Fusarium napiforme]